MRKLTSIGLCLVLCAAIPMFGGPHKLRSKNNDTSNQNGGAGGAGQLNDHGGPVITDAKVVFIFWGWSSKTTDSYITDIVAFRNSANGLVSHMGMLRQYRNAGSSSVVGSQRDVYDAVAPPTLRVTDAMVQAKVAASCVSLRGGCRTDTIYEVLIPSGYFSDDGSGFTSCGGPNLAYCAYHFFGDGVNLDSSIKYSIEPYPSCFGCTGLPNWTAANDQQHFIVHETREATSDEFLDAWYDNKGFEADDKCAWGRNLQFLFDEVTPDGTFAYQMEYSNEDKGCVK
jgi:hypothetical protein